MNVTVRLNKQDLMAFLEDTSDAAAAAEEYRAEYERRLVDEYGDGCSVEISSQTIGLGDNYIIDDERTRDHEQIPWIQEIANQMVNDWSWLTVT